MVALKKKEKAAQENQKLRKDQDPHDQMHEVEIESFIPLSCHYNPHTLLTKNGELMQVIKLTGFAFESVTDSAHEEKISVRRAIRQAIKDNIHTDHFAVWFHTVRRKADLSPAGVYTQEFCRQLNDAWNKRHDWSHQYVNEVYITIIHEGQALNLTDLGTFFRSLLPPAEIRYRKQYLKEAEARLGAVVSAILSTLQSYGARRLGIKGQDGLLYSEMLSFMGKIMNLADIDYPMDVIDLSDMALTHDLAFGFNAIEVSGDTGKHYAALMTVKEYQEVSSGYIDEFLQLPIQFVITETFDFVNSKRVVTAYSQQLEFLRLSRCKVLAESSGLQAMLDADSENPVAFGEHQITIMLLEDSLSELDREASQLIIKLREMGILAFREDVYMEDCFWAQLPGNFEFIKRMSFVSVDRIAGYASMYNFPAGRLQDGHWGDAVTVFRTAAGTPYFFNFHYHDCGHTLIIGPFGAGKTVLLNFLLSEIQKTPHRMFFFEQGRGSQIFINAIGGNYRRILRDQEHNQLRLNPLLLPDTKEARAFLEKWMRFLLADPEQSVSQEDQTKIRNAIDYAYSLKPGERKLGIVLKKFWPVIEQEPVNIEVLPDHATDASRKILESLNDEEESFISTDEMLKRELEMKEQQKYRAEIETMLSSVPRRLSMWYDDGRFSHVFDNAQDEIDFTNGRIFGFELTHMIQDQISLIPVMYYLMYRVNVALDGTPTILVLDEAWHMIDNPVFAPHMQEWLQELKQKNTMVIFATESVEDAEKSHITHQLTQQCKTQIFLPNPKASDAYVKIFHLSKEEHKKIRTMNAKRRQFLLRHDIDSVIAELDLSGFDYFLSVLSGREEDIALMEGAILDASKNPSDWLPLFKQRIAL